MTKKILVLQGANLNLLGTREPALYGSVTLDEIHRNLKELATSLSLSIDFLQSNHEGVLIDRIHQAFKESVNGIIINPGAFTHTSIALRDALSGVALPFIEVHISNIHARDSFRHRSYLSDIAAGVVVGFGADGYRLALLGLYEKLVKSQP